MYIKDHLHLGYMNVILLRGYQRHVSATHVAIVRTVRERTQIYVHMCRGHVTIKTLVICLKFRSVICYDSDEYKILEVKIYLECDSVE